MAWNPSPKVKAAREFARQFNKDKVIILGIDEANGQFELTSFGITKKECVEAKGVADRIYRLINEEMLEI